MSYKLNEILHKNWLVYQGIVNDAELPNGKYRMIAFSVNAAIEAGILEVDDIDNMPPKDFVKMAGALIAHIKEATEPDVKN